ncbi:MAG: FAD-binding protein [Chloroflexi bacterium]|nr:FAD-binding protein [Chloroflexota bacterium]
MQNQPSRPATWDRQADVVVVGFGGAGAAASVTAHDAGARVLMLEKAPKGQEGGNTRVAGQGYLFTDSAEKAIQYLNAMCGPFTVPQEMARVWAEENCKNNDWLASIGGDPQEHQHQPEGIEYPELPGSDSVHKFHHGSILGFSNTWKAFANAVHQRSIEILYETPAVELVQNPVTKEVLGVRAQHGGKPLYIKANRGVILTCGGFENNQEMIRNYLPGVPYCYTTGTPYNEGDGVRMAMEIGADLWHMNNYAGPSMALKVPEYKTTFPLRPLGPTGEIPGGMIIIGVDGKRFADEKRRTMHGKVKTNGRWAPYPTPCPMFMVFDHTLFSAGSLYNKAAASGWNPLVDRYEWSADNRAEVAKGWIKKADTLSALAGIVGQPAVTLEETVSRWNQLCDVGKDTDFGRTKMLSPIKAAPFYAVELSPSMLNTQGGPRRNEKAQIVRPNGAPIPRLYSAGELGSIFSYLYQGTGNIGECLAFGRIAGRNAAAETPSE